MSDVISTMMNEYFSPKIREFGNTNKGVDWNSFESQTLRFDQISRVFSDTCGLDKKDTFEVLDFGCGYGAYYDYLKERYLNVKYIGIDICNDMIDAAIKSHHNVEFIHTSKIPRQVDYIVASGIFNLKQDIDYEDWTEYVINTMGEMNAYAKKGFSFNCLTKYSDEDKMVNRLYYGDPMMLFDYAKRNFSRNVAVLHDYDLYEFTLLVKK